VVVVGAVPAAVLGLLSHLAVLRTQGVVPAPGSVPAVAPGTERSGTVPPEYRTDDELLAAARRADATYRESHGGKPITRDALRAVLHIGSRKASELLRLLRAEGGG
jgi:hypothetical protein